IFFMVKESFEPEFPPGEWPPLPEEYEHLPYERLARALILDSVADFLGRGLKRRYGIKKVGRLSCNERARHQEERDKIQAEASAFLFSDEEEWSASRRLWFHVA